MQHMTPLRRLLTWIDDLRWRHRIGWEAYEGDVTMGVVWWRDVLNPKRRKPEFL